jgi:tRNA(adenine34) deaminase
MTNHLDFMRRALAEGEAALDEGEFPVGCVFIRDGEIIASGRRKNSSGPLANEIDHAEVSVLRSLLGSAPGTDCSRITAYSTMEPCLMCYSTLLLSGIRRFVWGYEDIMGGATGLRLHELNELYAGMRVEIIPHVLRRECLQLFREFFLRHSYWENSALAEYTLAQPVEEDP